jgi:hypothetical protein
MPSPPSRKMCRLADSQKQSTPSSTTLPSTLHSLRQRDSLAKRTETALALHRRWRRDNRGSMAGRTTVEAIAWRTVCVCSILVSIPCGTRTMRLLWCIAHGTRAGAAHATWSVWRRGSRASAFCCAVAWLAIVRRVHGIEAARVRT